MEKRKKDNKQPLVPRVVCIIQARTGSTRLPGKILLKVSGKPVLIHEIERVLGAKTVDHIVLATTTNSSDDEVEKLITSYANPRVSVYRGSEDDVLDRYYQAATEEHADIVVRITGDCPLIDWELIDKAVGVFLSSSSDYVSNVLLRRTYPRGLDVEVFSFPVLEMMWKTCVEKREREHVTTFIREHPAQFKTKDIYNSADLSSYRWTLDERDDFTFITKVYDALYTPGKMFTTSDILDLMKRHPELALINRHVEQKKNIHHEAN